MTSVTTDPNTRSCWPGQAFVLSLATSAEYVVSSDFVHVTDLYPGMVKEVTPSTVVRENGPEMYALGSAAMAAS